MKRKKNMLFPNKYIDVVQVLEPISLKVFMHKVMQNILIN